MKIGILGSRGIPNHYGGFEQFAEILSAGLASKGHEVFVYNSSNHPYQQNKFGKINIVHCKDPGSWLGTAGQFIYDRNCLNDAMNRNYDVLLHLGYTSDSVWWRKWRKMKSTRHLVNMDGLEWKRTKYNRLTRTFLKKAEGLAVKHADRLIADSPAIADYINNKFSKKATYIPYGASSFSDPDPGVLKKFSVNPFEYSMLVARMEPENNIETIIKGFLEADQNEYLLIVGNPSNAFGKKMVNNYKDQRIRFAGTIYDTGTLNNLRYHSRIYFHGHSVGGTNPSLLEAMACNCNIIAHDNEFNRAVLGSCADYFSSDTSLANCIREFNGDKSETRKKANQIKIREQYNWINIIDAYERLMQDDTNAH